MNLLLIHNARIHTLDPNQPAAEALAILRLGPVDRLEGRILAVGREDEMLANYADPSGAGIQVEAWNARGRVILPGLTDAHLHLKQYAQSLQKVDCETPSRAECLARVGARSRNAAPGDWILGHGWAQAEWPEGFGQAHLLDEAAPGHPVYLTAKSLHAGWASSLALQAAGISAETRDPPGGKIQRDAGGEPTGILFENAMGLVERAIPSSTPEGITEQIRQALPQLWSVGLTSVHDFDRKKCFLALQLLRERSQLELRVIKNLPVELLDEIAGVGLRSGLGDDLLRIGGIKAFADGALGPGTAAMLEPYEDDATNSGMLLLDREELFEHGRQAADAGLSMTVHAIGDRANHEVLAAYEQLRQYEREQGLPALRHRIEHVQVLHPADIGRLANLDVIASMQPIHATSDMIAAERSWGGRIEHAYAWRSLIEAGTPLAFGSDAPVESPNPFWGLHAAVTRRRADGSPGPEGWRPQQRLRVEEALRAYTAGPAFTAGVEDRLGRLSPGFLADLLVLDLDPLSCPPDQLREIRPAATMVGGKWVFQK